MIFYYFYTANEAITLHGRYSTWPVPYMIPPCCVLAFLLESASCVRECTSSGCRAGRVGGVLVLSTPSGRHPWGCQQGYSETSLPAACLLKSAADPSVLDSLQPALAFNQPWAVLVHVESRKSKVSQHQTCLTCMVYNFI